MRDDSSLNQHTNIGDVGGISLLTQNMQWLESVGLGNGWTVAVEWVRE